MEPLDCSVESIAAAVARHEVSPVEVVRLALERIEHCDPTCNAFVEVHGEQAMLAAAEAERAVYTDAPLGRLHGVPLAIKDLFDTKRGWRNTLGSSLYGGRIAAEDSLNVRRLEAEGAILLGTTNTSELGHKCTTDNVLFGPTATPFAPARNAGGSSGGSAAAVASGMVPAATGSDGAGSLRVPASSCGVFTLKPTFGRVPMAGRPNGFRGSYPLAQNGVLSRTVHGATRLLEIMGAPYRYDPLVGPPFSWPTPAALERASLSGVRIGVCLDWGGFPIAAEVKEALQPMLADLERMGALLEAPAVLHRLAPEDLGGIIRRAVGLMLADLLQSFDPCDREEEMQVDVPLDLGIQSLIGEARGLQALELRLDDHKRTELFDGIQRAFTRYDLLVGPAVGMSAVANRTDGRTVGPAEIEGRAVDPLLGWCPAFIFNLTGHPAACVPGGETPEGVPVGLQLVADRHQDALALGAAAAIERDRPWVQRYARL